MAAPTTTVRVTPVGLKLDDGHSTKITFARDSDVSFWEKTVKPPGIEVGDAIDTTTMHNNAWETMAAPALKRMTDGSGKCAYDPNVYNNIINNLLGQPGAITVRFPDGSTLDFYGFLKAFEPDELQRGTQPEASYTIVCTNWDPTNDVEAGPVLTTVAGT